MRLKGLYTLFLALLLIGCSDNENFRINGTFDSSESSNIIMAYRSNGAYRTDVSAVREGKFEFFGSSDQPGVVELYDYNHRLLARLYARNGETFEIAVDRSQPLKTKVTGNEVSERWSAFLVDNADELEKGSQAANDLIAAYVQRHPADIVSTLLLTTLFDASAEAQRGDSLLSLIDAPARPSALTDDFAFMLRRSATAADSISTIRYADTDNETHILDVKDKPLTVIAFGRAGAFRTDSLVPAFDRLSRRKTGGAALLEIDFEPYGSTVTGASADTARWAIGRVPGGPASTALESLGIPSEPYFILADSTGRILYRGPHAGVAARLAADKLN